MDPLLSQYSAIMVRRLAKGTRRRRSDGLSQIDEAHERGAYTDLLLGLLKKWVFNVKGSLRPVEPVSPRNTAQDPAETPRAENHHLVCND